ncbi:hypothetical protein [Tautonia plasticadhaerens]|uniref:Uncharacterized protein n=1 Tax=Tautonia plasticadhaerens TaxID=2527974 RepID=A0A518GZR0_9BACT|nr:hypothetical protein [Tautonia plasticadhaerens]QDV34073.1 hypothetical protein ElP_19550 [Tautonia plasticadhaerens]
MRMLLRALARRLFGIPVLGMAIGIGMVASDPRGQEPEDRPVRADILDDPDHQATCPSCAMQRQTEAEQGRAPSVGRVPPR